MLRISFRIALAAVTLAATPAFGQAGGPPPAPSGGRDYAPRGGRDYRPVACIYGRSMRIPRAKLVALVKADFNPTDSDGKFTKQQLGEAVFACRSSGGWSKRQEEPAIKYLVGRVLKEDALYHGKDLGLTAEALDAVQTHVDAPTRTAFAAGQPSPEQLRVVMKQLGDAGVPVDGKSHEDVQRLAQIVAEGLAGQATQDAAVAEFTVR